MRHLALALILVTMGSAAALAQSSSRYPEDPSRFQISAGYDYVRANAPPSDCQCFGLQGGYLSVDFGITNWFSIEGEVTGQHGNDISALGQDLTLFTFAGGPKIHRSFGRFEPFAKVLMGGAHGSDSYFPSGTSSSTSASSLELSAGGGLDVLLTKHVAVRLFDVQYMRTELPNGVNNEQNHLVAGAGIVYRFTHHVEKMVPPPVAENQVALSCSSTVGTLAPGDTLEVIARSITMPANLAITYTWKSTVGTIAGTGDRITLDTEGVPPGEYHVMGHATVQGATPLAAECDVAFRIKTPTEAIKEPTPAPVCPPIPPDKDKEFHDNVPDAYFDYNSAAIRPDAQTAIEHAAEYLQKHPEIGVLLGGFADDRGSGEYNLVLGEKRAEATRKALIAAGVQPERLQIISYGKKVQVCTTEDEACRQQNRRVAFSMHP